MPSRRSLRAARPLEPGHVIRAEDITVLRPGDGLPPTHWEALVGSVVRRRLALHEAFAAEDLRESQRRMCYVD
jgi:sialic acid synthase SpsE